MKGDQLTLTDMILTQDAFLVELWEQDYHKQASEMLIARAKELTLQMVTEITELLNELPFKGHRLYPGYTIDIEHVTEEMVDIMKYLLGLGLNLGISSDDIANVWVAKSEIVHHRLRQERLLDQALRDKRKIAILDLDGVILDSHRAWLHWIKEQTGRIFKTRLDARTGLGTIQYELLKTIYRKTMKASVPQFLLTKRLVNTLKEQDYLVVIITARPFNRCINLLRDTVTSLEGVNYDLLFADVAKHARIKPYSGMVEIVVEDDLEQAISLTNSWTKTYLITNDENREARCPNEIIRVESIKALIPELRHDQRRLL